LIRYKNENNFSEKQGIFPGVRIPPGRRLGAAAAGLQPRTAAFYRLVYRMQRILLIGEQARFRAVLRRCPPGGFGKRQNSPLHRIFSRWLREDCRSKCMREEGVEPVLPGMNKKRWRQQAVEHISLPGLCSESFFITLELSANFTVPLGNTCRFWGSTSLFPGGARKKSGFETGACHSEERNWWTSRWMTSFPSHRVMI